MSFLVLKKYVISYQLINRLKINEFLYHKCNSVSFIHCVSFIFRYCVEFEILKASKACRKEVSYNALKEGNVFMPILFCVTFSWRTFNRWSGVCTMRIRSFTREPRMEMPGPWRWRTYYTLVSFIGAPLSWQMDKSPSETRSKMCDEDL